MLFQVDSRTSTELSQRSSHELQALKRHQHRKHTQAFDEAFAVVSTNSDEALASNNADSNSSEEFQIGDGGSCGTSRKSNDSDDDLRNVNVHRRMYAHSGDFRPGFAPMDNDFKSDDCDVDDDDVSGSCMTTSVQRRSMTPHQFFNSSCSSSNNARLSASAYERTPYSYSAVRTATSTQHKPYYGSTGSSPSRLGGATSAAAAAVANSSSSVGTTTGSSPLPERDSSYDREVRFRRQSDYTYTTRAQSARHGALSTRPDQRINFGLHGSSSVRIEKSESPTSGSGGGAVNANISQPQPVFGSELNTRKITESSMNLIANDKWRHERIDNLPAAAPITRNNALTSSATTAAKKRKKRGGKKGKMHVLATFALTRAFN